MTIILLISSLVALSSLSLASAEQLPFPKGKINFTQEIPSIYTKPYELAAKIHKGIGAEENGVDIEHIHRWLHLYGVENQSYETFDKIFGYSYQADALAAAQGLKEKYADNSDLQKVDDVSLAVVVMAIKESRGILDDVQLLKLHNKITVICTQPETYSDPKAYADCSNVIGLLRPVTKVPSGAHTPFESLLTREVDEADSAMIIARSKFRDGSR
jgi:hypothetical protein